MSEPIPMHVLIGAGLAVLALIVFVLTLLRRGRTVPQQLASTPKAKASKSSGRGDPLVTARALKEQGQIDQAFAVLVEAEKYDEAAKIALEAGKKDRAASAYERAGKYGEAAELLEQIRQFEPAAKLYLRANTYHKAADIYERLGRFDEAVEIYIKDGNHRAAAELYLKRREFKKAAEQYLKISEKILKELADNSTTEKRRKLLLKVGSDAAKVFEQTGNPELAAKLYKATGQGDAAAKLAIKLGRANEAAEALVAAGKIEEAVAMLNRAGEHEQAKRIQAKHFENSGEFLKAAEIYGELGEYALAADLFSTVGQHEKAARVMEQCNQFADAANYYLKAKNAERAAEMFERARLYNKAAALYQRLGKDDKSLAMLLAGGQLFEAGLTLARAGKLDDALVQLEKITKHDKTYLRAVILRADIHLRKGELALARALYEEGLAGEEIHSNNVENFYRYGVLLQNINDTASALSIYEKILQFDRQFRDVKKRVRALSEADRSISKAEAQPESNKKQRRYVILDELGRGGMGVVYKAMDRTLDRVVAFKVLPDEMRDNKAMIDNFFREAKSAAALNHPNIVTVFDAGQEDNVFYIAMEFIEGQTLKQLVREKGPFSPPLWILVFGQVLKALDYAHQQKIVHRDIKPSNLMWLDKEKQIKLTDFGLAKIIQETANFQTIIGGTPHYMSPEQILGGEVDARSDLYCLGATMFELATASVPYPKGDAGYHHIHSPLPDPRSLRPDFPAALAALLMKCMAKEPSQRYRSAAEALTALQEARNQI